jgi:tetratricopeptide (TPR) repeat protein
LSETFSLFKEAIAYMSYGTAEARWQLARTAIGVAESGESKPVKRLFVDQAMQELTAQAKESPLDARYPLLAGMMLNSYGDYAVAAAELRRAHDLAPKRQTVLIELALNAAFRGDRASARDYAEAAYALDPESIGARIYYAAALIRAGEQTKADAVLPIIPTDPGAVTNIDGRAFLALADSYYGSGNIAAAIRTLQSVGTLYPQLKANADRDINLIQRLSRKKVE